jgi:uncharacterized glyoxalase superfamily protein PhnB
MNRTVPILTAALLLHLPSSFAEGPKGGKPTAEPPAAKTPAAARATGGESMRITASAVSLTVDNVAASRDFLIKHFGFHVNMADEQGDFVSLGRRDSSVTVIFLRRGNKVLPEGFRDQRAAGLILAFTVKGLASEERRLRGEGVTITMPLREEPWGERLFQVTDPNGIVLELVEWAAPKEGT